MKKFRLSVIEIDEETGAERELINENENTLAGLTIMGDCLEDKGRAMVCIFHDNIAGIAGKIAGESRLMLAAKLAVMMNDYTSESSENRLIDSIIGGLQ